MLARLCAAALLATGMLAVPAAAAPATEWAQPGFGAGDTYANPGESVINAGTVDAVRRRWAAPLTPPAGSACAEPTGPLVSGGRVFVADGAGTAAYRAGTGGLIWRHPWSNPATAGAPRLAVAGDLLLVADGGCSGQDGAPAGVTALHLDSGTPAWRTSTPVPADSLVVDAGVAVVSGAAAGGSPAVLGIGVRDGVPRWRLDNYRSSGVSAGGRLMIGDTSGTETRAVSTATGRTLWSRRLAWTAEAAAPAGDRFYVSGPAGALICVRAADGSVVWTAPNRANSLIAADGRRLYLVIVNGVEALDARTGRHEWTAGFEGDPAQPVAAGGLLYTAVDAGEPLGILDTEDGTVASRGTQIGSMDGGNVVVVDGWIYLISGGGSLIGFAP